MRGQADFDVAVVGGGFGGLSAALHLAREGHRVKLCEALRYPGGCASTFARDGYRFEAGATLFSGLGPGQLLGGMIRELSLPVEVVFPDPVVTLRAPGLELPVPAERARFVERLCALPSAPVAELRAFFLWQSKLADVLWGALDDPEGLPPLTLRASLRHAARLRDYARLAPLVNRPFGAVLERFGLAGFSPFTLFCDAVCQITVQCRAAEAEAPFALAALDYFFRGAGHVVGGIGQLAEGICSAIRARGGEVSLPDKVKSIERLPSGEFRIEARRGSFIARQVVLNVLPGAATALLGVEDSHASALQARVDEGWGAAMLYRVCRAPAGAEDGPSHLELIADPGAPLTGGNHVFVSIRGARDRQAPDGLRSVTVSTHVPLASLRGDSSQRAATVQRIQDSMRRTIALRAPEWSEVVHELPASPRTFARFVGRPNGAVGGIPRRAGFSQYLSAFPRPLVEGAWLVGDSVFPGQSVLAAAVGGAQVARAVAGRLAR